MRPRQLIVLILAYVALSACAVEPPPPPATPLPAAPAFSKMPPVEEHCYTELPDTHRVTMKDEAEFADKVRRYLSGELSSPSMKERLGWATVTKDGSMTGEDVIESLEVTGFYEWPDRPDRVDIVAVFEWTAEGGKSGRASAIVYATSDCKLSYIFVDIPDPY